MIKEKQKQTWTASSDSLQNIEQLLRSSSDEITYIYIYILTNFEILHVIANNHVQSQQFLRYLFMFLFLNFDWSTPKLYTGQYTIVVYSSIPWITSYLITLHYIFGAGMLIFCIDVNSYQGPLLVLENFVDNVRYLRLILCLKSTTNC